MLKELIEAIIQNFSYIYPGFVFFGIYKYIKETETEDITLSLLKIVCYSYIMVVIVDAIWQLISQSVNGIDENVGSIVKTACLLFLSCILPFLAVSVGKSELFVKFLRWNKISIEVSKNDIELIVNKRPVNTIVYITVYLEDTVYTGVMIEAESGDNGFFYLNHWKKYSICKNNKLRLNNDKRQKSVYAVIPMRSVQHYYYEYYPMDAEHLPDEVF